MNNNELSLQQAAIYALNSVYGHLWYFTKFILFIIGIGIALGALPTLALAVLIGMLSAQVPGIILFPLIFMAGFGLLLVLEGVWYGGIKVILAYYDNGSMPVPFKTFYSIFHFKTLLNLLGCAIIFVPFTIVLYGLKNLVMQSISNGSFIIPLFYLALMIPAIIMIVRFGFGSLYIIDKNDGVFTALKKSWHVTRNYFKPLLWITAIAYLVYQVGSVLPFIQDKSLVASLVNLTLIFISLILIPVAFLMIIYAYRRLQE